MAEDLPDPVRRSDIERLGLRADCSACVGLCCVAPAFSAGADFAIDKPAGHACPQLTRDFRCGIHAQLRDRGFPGCTVFDCGGAGQKVVKMFRAADPSYGGADGADWRSDPSRATQLFDAFNVMRQLHELLWYLSAALGYPGARSRWPQLQRLLEETEAASTTGPRALAELDLEAHRSHVAEELRTVSTVLRPGPGPDLSGQDLMGKNLRRRDLRGAGLRNAYLLGADLRGVDLALADLIGADLRGADLRGADLSRALFVTQLQVNAARGNSATQLPSELNRPSHWPT